jgi:hypothetical protein
MAVHARPAAFDGPDGLPYSVAIMVDDTGDPAKGFGAYLLFLQWRRIGEPGVDTHLETDYLAFGFTQDAARDQVSALSLHAVKEHLDSLVNARHTSGRKWWDAMREDTE